MEKVMVRARQGVLVPKERSQDQIGCEPVCVPFTAYYRRRVRDGDLVLEREQGKSRERARKEEKKEE